MKNIRKAVSFVLCFAMVALLFAVIPVIPASATGGAVYSITSVPADNWRYITTNDNGRVIRNSGSKFSLKSAANQGTDFNNRSVMLANSLTTEVVTAATAYRISFHLSTWWPLSKLKAEIDTGTQLFSLADNKKTIASLTGLGSNTTGNASTAKLETDITIEFTTASNIAGNQHVILSVIPNTGENVGGDYNLQISNITITEKGYDIIDDETGEKLDTIYAPVGSDVVALLEENGYSKPECVILPDVYTIAEDTNQIRIAYRLKTVKQSIDFSGWDSKDWHYRPDSGKIDLPINQKVHHQNNTTDPGINSNNIADHSITLANNYANSGIEAGCTYYVQFDLSIPAASSLSDLITYIRFGTHIWADNIDTSQTIRYTGAQLAEMAALNSAISTGEVKHYNVSIQVTTPEVTNKNILLGICGGEYWLDDVTVSLLRTVPSFTSHSLVLSGEIGVNFYMNLSMFTEAEKAASYMTFNVTNGAGQPEYKSVPFSKAFLKEGSSGIYGFTCFLSSVQMAEAVTPTFHFGTVGELESSSYSVKQYIDWAEENPDSSDNLKNLVRALENYGYYAQQYFTDKTFTALTSENITDYSGQYSDYRAAVAEYAHANAGSVYKFNLNFSTNTILLTRVSGTLNVAFNSVTVGGNNYENTKTNYDGINNRVDLQISLPVLRLGDKFTINGTKNGTAFTVTDLSAMSYVYGILDKYEGTNNSIELRNLVCSLYDYYTNAANYAYVLDAAIDGEWI